MATLNETIEQVQNVFNDIEGALQEQGVNTENLKPVDYANAVRGIVNNISVENVSFLPVMIFCYSSSIPTKPTGGNWIQNEYTNQITPPEGWYLDLNDIEDASIGQDDIYMSVCIFKHDNTKYLDWTTPVRISGKDGKDGKTGKQGPAGNIAGVVVEYNTPLYTATTAQTAPDKPSCTYDIQNKVLNINSEGWEFDTPDEASLGANILWQSIARYYSDSQSVDCSNPVRISAGNPDVFKENGFYTEYCITKELNGSKTEWFTPASADPPVPTLSSPFLWARDVMNTTVTGKHVGPVYLFATYSAGLIGIDVSYACAPSKDALDALDESLWFNDSASALTPDATKEYQGLTEDTKYLWAREQFLYSNKEPDVQYRIVSTFTAAEKAAIIYSAGTFNEKVKYTRTEEQAPYVFFADGVTLDENNKYSNSGKKYYYFVLKYSYDDALYKIIPTNNTYPSIKDLYISSTASNKKCNWEKMESFDAIYSDIGVFKAANVGQFVFDDKYIFSQLGVDKDDKQEHNYTEYLDYSVGINNSEVKRKGVALAIETGQFIPNILLNAVTGEAKFGGGTNVLHPDGSFELADGNLQWKDNVLTVEGHVTAESFETKSSELETSISNLDNSVNSRITSASTKWANDLSEYQTATGETINQLNLRLDGAVSNYYKEGVPTISIGELKELFGEDNPNWDAHIGDTWTNINTYDESSEDENVKTGGLSWRWCDGDGDGHSDYVVDIGNKYHWHLISDTDATRALAKAGEALEAANSKTTTFISSKPENPKNGDLWIVPSDYNGDYRPNKTYVYNGENWQPWTDPDISDLDDIKNAFKSGVSGFEGGLIFGEALGVFDQNNTSSTNDDKLTAIINGNNQYSDDKGHTVIFASGIENNNISDAITTICSDGQIKTSKIVASKLQTVPVWDTTQNNKHPLHVGDNILTGRGSNDENCFPAWSKSDETPIDIRTAPSAGFSLSCLDWGGDYVCEKNDTKKECYWHDMLLWDESCIGRTVRIIHHKTPNGYASMTYRIFAPGYSEDGNHDWTQPSFYYDGNKHKTMWVDPNQYYEFYGYGIDNNFYGWIRTKLVDLYNNVSELKYDGMFYGFRPAYKLLTGSVLSYSPSSLDYHIIVDATNENSVKCKTNNVPCFESNSSKYTAYGTYFNLNIHRNDLPDGHVYRITKVGSGRFVINTEIPCVCPWHSNAKYIGIGTEFNSQTLEFLYVKSENRWYCFYNGTAKPFAVYNTEGTKV